MRRYVPKVVILDADNTLYDWVGYFACGWRGGLMSLRASSGLPLARLKAELRTVLIGHGSVEYDYAWRDGSLEKWSGINPAAALAGWSQQLSCRWRALRAYPGVVSGISTLREAGCAIVCLSEAHRSELTQRLANLDLLGSFDAIYCREDYGLVESLASERTDARMAAEAGIRVGVVREMPASMRKPDPRIMQDLLRDFDCSADDAVMLGDNLLKDVQLAKLSGVVDCWAQYGYSTVARYDLDMLLDLTDWPPDAVEAFLKASPASTGLKPSMTFDQFEHFVSWVLREWDRFELPKQARKSIQHIPLPFEDTLPT